MERTSNEAFLWSLFSGGGVLAALFIPIYLFLFFLAAPLGLMTPPTYERMVALIGMPLVKAYIFLMCALPLFHWAHRFRYTLYDGLQVKHLNEFIFTFCYGGAVVGTVLVAILLCRIG